MKIRDRLKAKVLKRLRSWLRKWHTRGLNSLETRIRTFQLSRQLRPSLKSISQSIQTR